MASIRFVWILPPLEVDPVRKDGVGVQVKVDGRVFVMTCTNLRDEVVRFGMIVTYTTDLAVSSSGEICTPCSTESRGAA